MTALERREVTPIGADKPEAIDVRIISATNLDETRLFDPAVFRPDLLFRLNTIVLRVPPLRARRDDIALLLAHYLKMYEAQYERPVRTVAGAALDALVRHDWPGNVRALRHACERAVILGQGAQYGLADFALSGPALPAATITPAAINGSTNADANASGGTDGTNGGINASTLAPAFAPSCTDHDGTLDALERNAIASTLARFNGNISHAAKTLGISRAALYRKLGKHGI